jgi:hypothetical protein
LFYEYGFYGKNTEYIISILKLKKMGVYFDNSTKGCLKGGISAKQKRHKEWRAEFIINGVKVRVGRFRTKEEALRADEIAQIQHRGELMSRPRIIKNEKPKPLFQHEAKNLLKINKFMQGQTISTQNWYEKKGHEIRVYESGFVHVDKQKLVTSYRGKILTMKRVICENNL